MQIKKSFRTLCASVLLLSGGFLAVPTLAQEKSVTEPIPITTPRLNIPIPTLPKLSDVAPAIPGEAVTIPWVGEYFGAAYQYFVGIAVIIAIIMMMIGGLQWSASAGSGERINAAKSKITNGLLGMFLALGSYLILFTINPDLVKFKALSIPSIIEIGINEILSNQHKTDEADKTQGGGVGTAEEQANKVKIQNCQSAQPSQKFSGPLTKSKMSYTYLGKLDCSGVKGIRDLKASGKKSGVTTVVLHEGGRTSGIIAWWNSQCAKVGECYGSHFNIEENGTIQQLAGIDKYVSHGNNTNGYSIGIDLDINIKSSVTTVKCLIKAKTDKKSKEQANKDCTGTYTSAQMNSIANLIKDLASVTEIKLAPKNIIPHCMVEEGTHADPRGFDFAKLGEQLSLFGLNPFDSAEYSNRTSKAKGACHLYGKHQKEIEKYISKYYK